MTEHLTLSDFLAPQIAAIRSAAKSSWVVAEISEFQDRGTIFLTLIEHGSDGNKLAKLSVSIWANGKDRLLRKFAEGGGGELKAGLKVLLKLRPVMHPYYGHSANVEDIDPAYSIGDAARKLAELRARLVSEGVIGRQRSLPEPKDFTRIGVVCPAGAAGLGDFKTTADPLEAAGLCTFHYFTATFQGERASAEVSAALITAFRLHEQTPLDAVVILRGGGAQSDLAWLNDWRIALTTARFPIPVMVAVGHERDTTILDEIANLSFHTPSKAAAHIKSFIFDNANAAQKDFDSIIAMANRVIDLNTQRIDTAKTAISSSSCNAVRIARQGIEAGRHAVIANARREVDLVVQDAQTRYRDIEDLARQQLSDADDRLEAGIDTVSQNARRRAMTAESGMQQSMLLVHGEASKTLALVDKDIDGCRNLIRDRSILGHATMARSVKTVSDTVFAKAESEEARLRTDIEGAHGLIQDRSRIAVDTYIDRTQRMGNFVKATANKELALVDAEVAGFRSLLRDRAYLGRDTVAERVEQAGMQIYRLVSGELAKSDSLVNGYRGLIRDRSYLAVKNAGDRVRANGELVLGFGPEKTLKRGFVMARHHDGRPATRKAQLGAGEHVELEFADGKVGAVVDSVPE
jgi:exodeoxyribonuclease VII large subunit